jgi:hypothetical protein
MIEQTFPNKSRRRVSSRRKPFNKKAIGLTFAFGLLAVLCYTFLYLKTLHAVTALLGCFLIAATLSIRPVNPTVRWFRLFILFSFGIFPIWQLLAGDEIYLALLPQDSSAVILWYLFTLAGITLLKFVIDLKARELAEWTAPTERAARVTGLAYVFAAMSLCALAFMYIKLGGYAHVSQLYDKRVTSNGTDYDPFRGLGVVQAFANTSPLWIFVCLTVRKRRTKLLTFVAFAQLGVLGWLSAGIAGSRQGIVFVLVFAFFIYHNFVNPISAKKARMYGFSIALTAVVLIPLKLGLGYGDILKLPERFAEQRQINLSMGPLSSVFFRDLSRFDVQIIAIDTIEKPAYSLSWGRSFVGAVASIIPTALWKGKPDTFAEEKNDIVKELESGTLDKTTLLFGMPGEFLVNFGPPGFVLSFLIPAYLLVALSKVERRSRKWLPLRAVMWPLPFLFFLFDSNVLVYYVVRWILLFGVPMAFALQWPRKRRVPIVEAG